MQRKILIVFAGLVVLGLGNYALNETPLLFSEPAAYTVADPAQYFSPAVAPVFQTRPEHDTLIIFFHGFPASPREFRLVAQSLAGEYDIDVPLLPGFGTTTAAVKQSNFSQWLAYARAEYLKQRPRYAHVYLCGQSMGGTLVLRLAETLLPEETPTGIIVLSTPVFLNNVLGAGVYYDWRLYFSRILSWVISELHVQEPQVDQDGAEWVGFKGVKFLKQVHSLKMGMRQTRLALGEITVPALIMNAQGDKTVPFKNGFYVAGHIRSTIIRLRIFDLRAWKHTRHLLSMYRTTRGQVVEEIRRFVQDGNHGFLPDKSMGR
ncbi:MAG: alpha/beta fold hydrolase [Candidatus Firestonebacteria bacterium]|nr:alpha/beta fold hydrolase [Candidatus Firestonebacteria bacterium]